MRVNDEVVDWGLGWDRSLSLSSVIALHAWISWGGIAIDTGEPRVTTKLIVAKVRMVAMMRVSSSTRSPLFKEKAQGTFELDPLNLGIPLLGKAVHQ